MTAKKFISKDASGRKGRLDHDANTFISEAFLGVLGSIFGGYDRYFDKETRKFKFDEFKAAAPKQHQAVRILLYMDCGLCMGWVIYGMGYVGCMVIDMVIDMVFDNMLLICC